MKLQTLFAFAALCLSLWLYPPLFPLPNPETFFPSDHLENRNLATPGLGKYYLQKNSRLSHIIPVKNYLSINYVQLILSRSISTSGLQKIFRFHNVISVIISLSIDYVWLIILLFSCITMLFFGWLSLINTVRFVNFNTCRNNSPESSTLFNGVYF